MKALSTLNPYAESYVPISQRDSSSEKQDSVIYKEFEFQKLTITSDTKLMCQKSDNPKGNISPSNRATEMEFAIEEYEMDLAYLQMSFPGMSDQSLTDVYNVNGGDLESSLEMLSQLESVEILDGLPDALDIGDIPEPTPSGECSSANEKKIIGESSASSGSSGLVVPS